MKPPRVARSPIALECKYWRTIEMPAEKGHEHQRGSVVFDVLFSEARGGDMDFARELSDRVVIAGAALPFPFERSAAYRENLREVALRDADTLPSRAWSDITLPLEIFTRSGARVGVISVQPDEDGVLRRLALVVLAVAWTAPRDMNRPDGPDWWSPVPLAAWDAGHRVLTARGIAPQFVAGHSLGEYSANVAAGTFSFADAVRTVRHRGRRR